MKTCTRSSDKLLIDATRECCYEHLEWDFLTNFSPMLDQLPHSHLDTSSAGLRSATHHSLILLIRCKSRFYWRTSRGQALWHFSVHSVKWRSWWLRQGQKFRSIYACELCGEWPFSFSWNVPDDVNILSRQFQWGDYFRAPLARKVQRLSSVEQYRRVWFWWTCRCSGWYSPSFFVFWAC